MDDLLRSNILNTFEVLSKGLPEFSNDWPDNLPKFGYGSITPTPIFAPGNPVRCAQADFFGFYALRAAVRGVFLSVNFFGSSKESVGKKQLLDENLRLPFIG